MAESSTTPEESEVVVDSTKVLSLQVQALITLTNCLTPEDKSAFIDNIVDEYLYCLPISSCHEPVIGIGSGNDEIHAIMKDKRLWPDFIKSTDMLLERCRGPRSTTYPWWEEALIQIRERLASGTLGLEYCESDVTVIGQILEEISEHWTADKVGDVRRETRGNTN